MEKELADVKKSGDNGGRQKHSLITDGKNFVKWSEGFMRWVKREHPQLLDLFAHAARAKHPIDLRQCPELIDVPSRARSTQ